MRVREIVKGRTYTDGKGGIREVILFQHHPIFEDAVIFKYIRGAKPVFRINTGQYAGYYVVGLQSFARWAQREGE